MDPMSDTNTSCDCGITKDRRTFLRDAAIAVAGALVAVGMPRGLAAQMPLDFTSALKRETKGDGAATLSYAIPAADGAQIDKQNEVILVRWQNAVYAFNLSCPHQNTALRWDDADKRFQCPKHHSRYQPDGTFIDGRATRGMDRFTIARTGNNVTVDVDKLHKQDEDPAGWNAAVVKL
jgi:Rieske Fe-S protein